MPELSSWKEIAHYLGVSVRTAQSWERDRGLPVHRFPGARSQVRASVSELESWRQAAPSADTESAVESGSAPSLPPAQRQINTVWLWLSLAMGVAALGLWVLNRPALAGVRLDSDGLLGVDERGNVLWRHGVTGLRPELGRSRYWSGDLDGDGQLEVLLASAVEPGLTCLNADGKVRWRYVLSRSIRDPRISYDPPWIANSFIVYRNKVVVATRHHSHYPTQVALIDANGVRLSEYWHTGHLAPLMIGKYKGRDAIFAGGVNNARRAATLVVLDPERFSGWGAEAGGHQFADMAEGKELARLIFARSSIDFKSPYNVTVGIVPSDQGIIVDVAEAVAGENHYSIAYYFDQELNVKAVSFSDQFELKFRETFPGKPLDEERAKLKVTRIE